MRCFSWLLRYCWGLWFDSTDVARATGRLKVGRKDSSLREKV